MRIVYTGTFDEVEVPELNLTATRGVSVEVADEVGERLCQQSCWEEQSTDDAMSNAGSLHDIEVRRPIRKESK